MLMKDEVLYQYVMKLILEKYVDYIREICGVC